jgi:hypothetical protein
VSGTDLQTVLNTFLPIHAAQHPLHPRQRQVCAHIQSCRTAALGGRVQACDRCDYSEPRYHACRDRHCPKCQGRASAQWSERQLARLLPVPYYHLVFTLPHALNPWVQHLPRVLYRQLFASAWATLAGFAANPRRLGGQLGATLVLHTWGQTLSQHVHLHGLVPGGALTTSGDWRPAKGHYLFPLKAVSRHFRGHFVAGLRSRVDQGELTGLSATAIDAMLDALMKVDWVVYAKPCLGHTGTVVTYLARYSHRTALGDHRLIGIDADRVGLRYTDYRDGVSNKVLWLSGAELVRRFLLHVLPKGLMRIRHYGFLANRCGAARIRKIRQAIERGKAQEAAMPKRDRADAEFIVATARTCPRCRRGRLHLRDLPVPARLEGG